MILWVKSKIKTDNSENIQPCLNKNCLLFQATNMKVLQQQRKKLKLGAQKQL